MIAHIRGKILSKGKNSAVIEACQIGYEIILTERTLIEIGEPGDEVSLHLSETSSMYSTPALYGFPTETEKALFELLKSAPKAGPKKAMDYLNRAQRSLPDFKSAVMGKDLKILTGIFGFSRKSAENIVSALRDKIRTVEISGEAKIISDAMDIGMRNRLGQALSSLGFRPQDIKRALESAAGEIKKGSSDEEALKTALRYLSGKG